MLTKEEQIQNIDKLFVLKECWAGFCGMGSNQRIINNRWMIPITWVAEQCSMNPVQVLEEHLFASGLNVNSVGKMDFLREYANKKGYDLTAVVCSTLRYEDESIVYADTTEANRK